MELSPQIPPGVRFLARTLPYLLTPPLVVYTGLRALDRTSEVHIPSWLIISATVLCQPFLFVFSRYYARFSDARQAASRGAHVIPHVKEKRPAFGGVSIIKTLIKDLETNYPGDLFGRWMGEYGNTYVLRMPTDNRILTFEPDHVKAILATQFDAFEKGPIFIDQFKSFLGTGVFNADGDMWKFHRAITRPFFTKDRIAHFDIFERHADDALKQAATRLREGNPVDIQDLVSRFTLDSATEFLFGHDVKSLSAGLPYPASSPLANSPEFLNHPSTVFVDAFSTGQVRSAQRARLGPSWPVKEFWRDQVMDLKKPMDQLLEPILQKALEKKKKRDDAKAVSGKEGGNVSGDEEEETVLLSHLVNQTQDPVILKDELLNLLVAGRDTTACLLTFAFYMLAEHPNVETRLREEIIRVVGPTQRPTYDNIRDMKYLRAFVNEVLRLFPPVPFDSRFSTKATVWTSKAPGSKPFYVPARTRILYGVLNMQRRTDLWGPDALEFDPDRFIDERLQKYLLPNPYIFCPFNAGPRICLGQQFAYNEASFFLVRLLQQFTGFALAPDAQPADTLPPASWKEGVGRKKFEKVVPGIHLTMYVKGGLWARMRELEPEADLGTA